MKPFDYLNAINFTKENIIQNSNNPELAEQLYVPYVVNKGLSYFIDTILLCNEINQRHYVDHKLQFDFLINTIRKRKRFSKWYKKEEDDSLDLLSKHYGYSYEKAKQVLPLLNEKELNKIKNMYYTGGLDGCRSQFNN